MQHELSHLLKARAAHVLGWTPQSWRSVSGGYTPAARFAVAAGLDRAFVKVATTSLSAAQPRQEAFVYHHLQGDFMPGLIGWDDDELEPMLILEDLSESRRPPPWDGGLLNSVLVKITALHSSRAPLRPFREVHGSHGGGWRTVAANSAPFLKLGLTTSDWLFRSLPQLMEAGRTVKPKERP